MDQPSGPRSIELPRSGGSTIRFNGEVVTVIATGPHQPRRHHVVTLYRAFTGNTVGYIVGVDFCSTVEREPELHYASPVLTGAGVAAWLEAFATSPELTEGVTGFVPTGRKYIALREHITRSMRNAFKVAASSLCISIPESTTDLS